MWKLLLNVKKLLHSEDSARKTCAVLEKIEMIRKIDRIHGSGQIVEKNTKKIVLAFQAAGQDLGKYTKN